MVHFGSSVQLDVAPVSTGVPVGFDVVDVDVVAMSGPAVDFDVACSSHYLSALPFAVSFPSTSDEVNSVSAL